MDRTAAAHLLDQAEVAKNNNEYAAAVACYAELLAQTESSADDLIIKEMRLTALREQGELHRLLGEPEEALSRYEQYYLEAGTSQHAVDALVLLGTQQTRMSQLATAMETFREALQLAEALNYTGGRARVLQGIGGCLKFMGRAEEGASSFQKALSLFEQLDDDIGQMHTWNWLGIAYIDLGAVDKAIHAFTQCLQWARQVGKRETAITLGNLGECYQNLYDMEQALLYHQEGLKLAQEIELKSAEADLTRNMGVDLWQLGRIDEARTHLYRALDLTRETKNPDVEAQTMYALALLEMQHGDAERGLEHARQMKKMAEADKARGRLGDALHAIGLYHQTKGELTLAQQVWQEALFLAHETTRRMLLWQLHAALAGIAENEALASVHCRIAGEVIQQIAYPIADEALREKFLNAPQVQKIVAQSAL